MTRSTRWLCFAGFVALGACRNERVAAPIEAVAPAPSATATQRPVPADECASAPPLAKWREIAPLTSDEDRACANRDPCMWYVSVVDDDVVASPERSHGAEAFGALGGVVQAKRVSDGWLVTSNRGEFGADVFWFAPDMKTRRRLGGDSIAAMIDVGGEVWLFAGLDHLTLHPGKVFRAERDAREWKLSLVASLSQSAYAAVAEGDGALVVTTTQLLRVHRDGRVEKLHEDEAAFSSARATPSFGSHLRRSDSSRRGSHGQTARACGPRSIAAIVRLDDSITRRRCRCA